MHNLVIADTSSLILFSKINQIDILKKVYSEIIITPEILKEFEIPPPDWMKIAIVKDKKYQALLETYLDLGESSAIALAMEMKDSLLILDDLKARKFAKKLGMKFTGSLGVINKAKEIGVVKTIKPIIDELRKTNFRVSDKIIEFILERNGELK
jgi:predicted nucleic acid-binding protein